MPGPLTIRLRIPLTKDPFLGGSLVFTRWLPLEEWNSLVLERDGMTLKVWFDMDCLQHLSDIAVEDVAKHLNLRIGIVGIDLAISEIEDDLIDFIYNERDRPKKTKDQRPSSEEYERLSEQYSELGKGVMRVAVAVFNRLVDYFRVEKGQYWVERLELDERNQYSFFSTTDAKVHSERYDPVRWCPPPFVHHITASRGDSTRFVREADWPNVAQFVRGSDRPDLTLELLANAERLLDEGYGRSALVEAVAALEYTLHRFTRSADRDRLERPIFDRIRFERLDALRKKLGLRGSLWTLVPLLVPEHILSRDLLDQCIDAVDQRGNLLHGTPQRTARPEKARQYLKAIREMCSILHELTLVDDLEGGVS